MSTYFDSNESDSDEGSAGGVSAGEITPAAVEEARALALAAKNEGNASFSAGKLEEAVAKYGEENIEVYLYEFTTLELSAVHRVKHISHGEDEDMSPCCFSKLITVKNMNEKVVGVHFVGPNAGEVVQGFALGIKLGATKDDFNNLVGIHPTDAESFCSMEITKRSGQSYMGAGCGGGVCG